MSSGDNWFTLRAPQSTERMKEAISVETRMFWALQKSTAPAAPVFYITESTAGGMLYVDVLVKPSWQSQISQDLRRIAKLDESWDGEVAPPNKNAREAAQAFFEYLIESEYQPTNIRVSPSVEEGIGFSFWARSKYAVVEFLNDGTIARMLSPRHGDPDIRLVSFDETDLRKSIDEVRYFLY